MGTCIVVARDVSQSLRFWLNITAFWNMYSVLVTWETSQSERP